VGRFNDPILFLQQQRPDQAGSDTGREDSSVLPVDNSCLSADRRRVPDGTGVQ
jgi:hypothetical protein